ncbi:MAG: hypothetical protein EOP24_26410 [Hyphomicrobiales bacterium]|nr:MAG: hypothetical protein EOP24_26410 [Hyphomicrobiales bacterium]
MTKQCICHRCIQENDLHVMAGDMKLPLSMTQMILCPTCGCKRCPHASDHRLACTDSNEAGQPGSIYGKFGASKLPDSPPPT